MASGKRIKAIRTKKKMTQKELGIAAGFDKKTADIRIAQYESETRTPKENLVNAIANALEVSPMALNVPNIDSYVGIMHTLFALEDIYGLHINCIDDQLCLTLTKTDGPDLSELYRNFKSWHEEYDKLTNEQISNEEYDHWRYTYPQEKARRDTKRLTDALRADKEKRTFK